MSPLRFTIKEKVPGTLARLGELETPHGKVETPSFAVVGTKATVKALTPQMLKEIGSQLFLSNTYHLEMRPGSEILASAGGLSKFSGWNGPTMTDSGGFQAFSLGVAYGKGVTKFTDHDNPDAEAQTESEGSATVTDEGVTFKSHIDGSTHFFSPEKSIEIQHNIGADIIVVLDEPTAPHAPVSYQKIALARTHAWAKRCLDFHRSKENSKTQGLYAVVQGGKFLDLRKESATFLAGLDFDGYAIGGSYSKKDIGEAVYEVNKILPEDKPRHLLGIGEPLDIFAGVEAGCDTFDCVLPTRNARNGRILTHEGRFNITNSKYKNDFSPLEDGCECYACKNFTKSYISHLFRADEILGKTLASLHNVYFIESLFKNIREAIRSGTYESFKEKFLKDYNI